MADNPNRSSSNRTTPSNNTFGAPAFAPKQPSTLELSHMEEQLQPFKASEHSASRYSPPSGDHLSIQGSVRYPSRKTTREQVIAGLEKSEARPKETAQSRGHSHVSVKSCHTPSVIQDQDKASTARQYKHSVMKLHASAAALNEKNSAQVRVSAKDIEEDFKLMVSSKRTKGSINARRTLAHGVTYENNPNEELNANDLLLGVQKMDQQPPADQISEGQASNQSNAAKMYSSRRTSRMVSRDTRRKQRSRPRSAILSKELDQMALIRQILSKDPKERSSAEIKEIQKSFADNTFFAEIRKTRDEKTNQELCEKLRLEEHSVGSVVFHFGDPGNHFYIILSGSVYVRVPSAVQLQQDSVTPEGLLGFILSHFDDLHWQAMPSGKAVLQLLYGEMRRCHIEVDESGHFDAELVLKAFDREISMKTTKIHMKISKLLNPENADSIVLQWFKTVATLKAGENFGELALQYNQGRAATIICTEATKLASLSRFDFSLIIGKQQRRKMKKIVDEMMNYRIFSQLRQNKVAKIYHYMKQVDFKRGQVVFKEGQSLVDRVYFIISGEFAVTKALKAADFIQSAVESAEKDGDGVDSRQKALLGNQSPIRGRKAKEMLMQSRANRSVMATLEQKKNQHLAATRGQKTARSSAALVMRSQPKIIQLYLLGKNEVFGMEEIVDMMPQRSFTVTCASTNGTAYVMSREHFQDCVNQFKFSDQIIEELLLKHKLFRQRVLETHVFQQNFLKSQHEKFKQMQAWAQKTEAQTGTRNQQSTSPARSDSRLELSSSFLENISDVTKADEKVDMLYPRKADSQAIRTFKKSMLETIVKPMSWKDHRNKIEKSQQLFAQRQLALEHYLANNSASESKVSFPPGGITKEREGIQSGFESKGSTVKAASFSPSDRRRSGSRTTRQQSNELPELGSVGQQRSVRSTTVDQGYGGWSSSHQSQILPPMSKQGSQLSNPPRTLTHSQSQNIHMVDQQRSQTVLDQIAEDELEQGKGERHSYKLVKESTKQFVTGKMNEQEQHKLRRTIGKHSFFLINNNILHQMITPKTGSTRTELIRQQSIKKIGINLSKLNTLAREDSASQKQPLHQSGSKRNDQASGTEKRSTNQNTVEQAAGVGLTGSRVRSSAAFHGFTSNRTNKSHSPLSKLSGSPSTIARLSKVGAAIGYSQSRQQSLQKRNSNGTSSNTLNTQKSTERASEVMLKLNLKPTAPKGKATVPYRQGSNSQLLASHRNQAASRQPQVDFSGRVRKTTAPLFAASGRIIDPIKEEISEAIGVLSRETILTQKSYADAQNQARFTMPTEENADLIGPAHLMDRQMSHQGGAFQEKQATPGEALVKSRQSSFVHYTQSPGETRNFSQNPTGSEVATEMVAQVFVDTDGNEASTEGDRRDHHEAGGSLMSPGTGAMQARMLGNSLEDLVGASQVMLSSEGNRIESDHDSQTAKAVGALLPVQSQNARSVLLKQSESAKTRANLRYEVNAMLREIDEHEAQLAQDRLNTSDLPLIAPSADNSAQAQEPQHPLKESIISSLVNNSSSQTTSARVRFIRNVQDNQLNKARSGYLQQQHKLAYFNPPPPSGSKLSKNITLTGDKKSADSSLTHPLQNTLFKDESHLDSGLGQNSHALPRLPNSNSKSRVVLDSQLNLSQPPSSTQQKEETSLPQIASVIVEGLAPTKAGSSKVALSVPRITFVHNNFSGIKGVSTQGDSFAVGQSQQQPRDSAGQVIKVDLAAKQNVSSLIGLNNRKPSSQAASTIEGINSKSLINLQVPTFQAISNENSELIKSLQSDIIPASLDSEGQCDGRGLAPQEAAASARPDWYQGKHRFLTKNARHAQSQRALPVESIPKTAANEAGPGSSQLFPRPQVFKAAINTRKAKEILNSGQKPPNPKKGTGEKRRLASSKGGTRAMAAIEQYALVLPEYLNKPIVKQRQRMMGQLKSLSQANSTAALAYNKRSSAVASLKSSQAMPLTIKSHTAAAALDEEQAERLAAVGTYQEMMTRGGHKQANIRAHDQGERLYIPLDGGNQLAR